MNGMKLVSIAAAAVIPLGSLAHWGIVDYGAKLARERVTATVQATQQRARSVTYLVEQCRQIGNPGRIELRGKAILWDLSGDSFGVGKLSPAQNNLPPDLTPQLEDAQVTVFLVVERHNVKGIDYQGGLRGFENNQPVFNTIPSFRVDLDVAVVYLPEYRAAGLVRVRGAQPPAQIKRPSFDNSPEYGDTVVPLAEWVKARVHSPQLPVEEESDEPKNDREKE